jgi:hypothetical protein
MASPHRRVLTSLLNVSCFLAEWIVVSTLVPLVPWLVDLLSLWIMSGLEHLLQSDLTRQPLLSTIIHAMSTLSLVAWYVHRKAKHLIHLCKDLLRSIRGRRGGGQQLLITAPPNLADRRANPAVKGQS